MQVYKRGTHTHTHTRARARVHLKRGHRNYRWHNRHVAEFNHHRSLRV